MLKRLLVLFVLLLTGCQLLPSQRQNSVLHHVVDGDTVDLVISDKVERVRLLLIDTPEHATDQPPQQPYAKDAQKRLEQLLTQAKQVDIAYEKDGQRDKYGRLLAYVFVDGELVQDILVREGYARVAYFKGKEQYYMKLKNSEEHAKTQRLGIWSIDGYVTDKGYNYP